MMVSKVTAADYTRDKEVHRYLIIAHRLQDDEIIVRVRALASDHMSNHAALTRDA